MRGVLGMLVAMAAAPAGAAAQVVVEAEAGGVGATRNDVRVPGAGGSGLSLVDDLSSRVSPAFRIRLGARFAERHFISALYAPLQLTSRGSVDRSVSFAGASFAPGTPLFATYRFDSYRLTYRYSFVRDDSLEVAAGATAKIRDAEVSLYGAQTGRKTNTGFVPLLNFHLEWRPGQGRVGLLLDADALAAPQGRAEDVLVAITWQAREKVGLYAGYRMLEGGADNDEVYSFAWLHYAVGGVRIEL